jgi:2-oxoglutarate dehydrogenase E2 component (dihydrolipoamide succinyltransferase)
VYNDEYNIGIAVSTQRGLIVPILRGADGLSFAEIEKRIRDFAGRARDKKLGIDDLTGGTFSITNGGVFGSMLSTPIPSPPQSAILGMHAIQERPVVKGGEIVARPVMYVALTYDHRLIDGSEAVSFLVRVKECIEDPERMFIDI